MLFALLPIISFPIKAKAKWGIDNGLEYEIVGDEVFIRNYDDSDSEFVIPAQIEGISKISISSGAFTDCHNLESVVSNGNVGDIGENAFCCCDKLERVVFNGNVGDIGENAFFCCDKLEKVVFNGNVGDIGENAFFDCFNLKSVVFNGNVEQIYYDAFFCCLNLKSVVFNGNVGGIEGFAFEGSNLIKSIVFSGNAGNIDKYAFSDICNPITFLISKKTTIDTKALDIEYDSIVSSFNPINGQSFDYTGNDLSEKIYDLISVSGIDEEDYNIVFKKKENLVNNVTDVGEYIAVIQINDSDNQVINAVEMKFNVKKDISKNNISADISSKNFTYSGEDLNNKVNIAVKDNGTDLASDNYKVLFSLDNGTNWDENMKIIKPGTYSVKLVGESDYTGEKILNDKIIVEAKPVTIIASDAQRECDGSTLTENTFVCDNLATGDSIKSITITGSQKGPGQSVNVPSAAVIVNAAGEDVTDCYDITYKSGTLTVNAHIFDQKIATNEYLAVDATFTSPAKYYKSCLCGEKGEETFEAGDPLPTYTITFDANGGVVDIEVNGTNEEYKLDSLPTPTYEGYDFKGWYTNATGGTEITTDTVFGANMTIYAHWEKKEEPKPAQDGNSEDPETPEDPQEPQEPDPEVELPEKDWLDDLWLALHIADELGGAQTVEYSGDFALSYDIMNYLVEHPSITFVYHVKYEDVEYTIIIPSGKAVSSPEIPWYGPLWLLANYGNGNVPAGVKENGTY